MLHITRFTVGHTDVQHCRHTFELRIPESQNSKKTLEWPTISGHFVKIVSFDNPDVPGPLVSEGLTYPGIITFCQEC